MANWNDSVEEQFVNMIEERPALYSITDKSYNNRNLKADIWREIEFKLKISEKELRTKWDSLRTQYTRYQKLPEQRTKRQLWILTRLKFLESHTKRKDHLNRLESPAVDHDSPSECTSDATSSSKEEANTQTGIFDPPSELLTEQVQIERVTVNLPELTYSEFGPLLEMGSIAIWNDNLEEQFINMVEERPVLYNITDKNYNNRLLKADIWRKIESKLQISEKELRKRWDSLRTQYTRYHKLPSSGSAGAQRTPRQLWILTRLQFLEPHVTKRKESTSHINGQESPAVEQGSPSECTSDATSSSKEEASTQTDSPEAISFDPPPELLSESSVCEQAQSEKVTINSPVWSASEFGPLLETGSTVIWNDSLEEQLINMIEERPALYNMSEISYSNRNLKADIWREIESKLQISEKEIRKRWESLRTQYTRYHKLPSTGSAGAQRTPRQLWILTRLQFLEPHTKRKESTSHLNGQESPAVEQGSPSECTSDTNSSIKEEASPEATSFDPPPELLSESSVCEQAPSKKVTMNSPGLTYPEFGPLLETGSTVIWSDSLEEQLINMIEERPALYNMSEISYSNRNLKADIWREIESKLKISEKEIKKRWESLRTQYTRYHKLPSSGSAGAQRTPRQLWILTRLQFLEPHVTKRKESTSHLNGQESPAVDQGSPSECSDANSISKEEATGSPDATSFDPPPDPEQAPISPSECSWRRAVAKRRRTDKPLSASTTDLMTSIKNVLDRTSQETEDSLDLYFKYLKSSVRGLPDHLRQELLHEMDNLLYKYKGLHRSQSDAHVTPI